MCHRYLLDNGRRGIKAWNKAETDGRGSQIDLAALCHKTIGNVERCRNTRASDINKIFDNVKTIEDLYLAEMALLSFRKSYNIPHPSLPRVVTRACIRVQKPKKALQFIKHKVQYGVFPTVNVYNILMDAFLAQKDGKGIIDTYQQILLNELKPNAMTYYLTVYGYMLQYNDESYSNALEMCQRCKELSVRTGIKAYHILLRMILDKEDKEKAKALLMKINSEFALLNKFDVNWRIRGFVTLGLVEQALDILNLVCDNEEKNLSVSEGVVAMLEEVVTEEKEVEKVKELRTKLDINGKLISEQ